jgi:hypothetical protein
VQAVRVEGVRIMSRKVPVDSMNDPRPSMSISSGTSIRTDDTGPVTFPARSRTASLPRKWSIRKIRSSGKTARTVSLSSRAEARSWPNGFSTIRRASSARPVSPSMRTMGPIASGGTDRYSIVRASSPSSARAARTAAARSSPSSLSDVTNER